MLCVKLPQIYSPEVMAVVCEGPLLLTNWARQLRDQFAHSAVNL